MTLCPPFWGSQLFQLGLNYFQASFEIRSSDPYVQIRFRFLHGQKL